MQNNMIFSFGGLGAGMEREIKAPKIEIFCPYCKKRMILIDGRGLLNSGRHSFTAQCPECKKIEKFSDYELWKRCLTIVRKYF